MNLCWKRVCRKPRIHVSNMFSCVSTLRVWMERSFRKPRNRMIDHASWREFPVQICVRNTGSTYYRIMVSQRHVSAHCVFWAELSESIACRRHRKRKASDLCGTVRAWSLRFGIWNLSRKCYRRSSCVVHTQKPNSIHVSIIFLRPRDQPVRYRMSHVTTSKWGNL